jgi:hypothetical protein
VESLTRNLFLRVGVLTRNPKGGDSDKEFVPEGGDSDKAFGREGGDSDKKFVPESGDSDKYFVPEGGYSDMEFVPDGGDSDKDLVPEDCLHFWSSSNMLSKHIGEIHRRQPGQTCLHFIIQLQILSGCPGHNSYKQRYRI